MQTSFTKIDIERIQTNVTSIMDMLVEAKEFYKNRVSLNLDLGVVTFLKKTIYKLEACLEYLNYVGDFMTPEEAKRYKDEVPLKDGYWPLKDLFVGPEDLESFQTALYVCATSEQLLQQLANLSIFIKRDQSMVPTEEERDGSRFFDFEVTRKAKEKTYLKSILDFRIDDNKIDTEKVYEYLNKKIPNKFILENNKLSIKNVDAYKKVSSFLGTFLKKNYIKKY